MYSGGSRFSPGFRAWIAVSVEQVRHGGGEGATPRQRGGARGSIRATFAVVAAQHVAPPPQRLFSPRGSLPP